MNMNLQKNKNLVLMLSAYHILYSIDAFTYVINNSLLNSFYRFFMNRRHSSITQTFRALCYASLNVVVEETIFLLRFLLIVLYVQSHAAQIKMLRLDMLTLQTSTAILHYSYGLVPIILRLDFYTQCIYINVVYPLETKYRFRAITPKKSMLPIKYK